MIMFNKIISGMYNERGCLCCVEALSHCVSLKISIAYQSITAVFELWRHARVDLVPCNTFPILHNNCILLQLGYWGQKQTLAHDMHARCQVWIGLEKMLEIVYFTVWWILSTFSLIQFVRSGSRSALPVFFSKRIKCYTRAGLSHEDRVNCELNCQQCFNLQL